MKHDRQPNRIEVLKDLFWSGEINDSEFYRLAFEDGLPVFQIGEFMDEVRKHDGILA